MKLWLNVDDGVEYAGVCRDLIYDACAARRIRHIRIDGRRAIQLTRECIDAWLERHVVEAQDGPLPMRGGRRLRADGRQAMSANLTTHRLRADTTTDDGEEPRVSRRCRAALPQRRRDCGAVADAALSTRWSTDANSPASSGFVAASCSAPTLC